MIRIARSGAYSGANTHTDVLRALAQQNARTRLAVEADVTDSSGGSVSGTRALADVAAFVNVAAGGTSEVQTITVTAAASGDGNLDVGGKVVAVANLDTTAQVATKIAAALTADPLTSMTTAIAADAVVTVTFVSGSGDVGAISFGAAATGVTATVAEGTKGTATLAQKASTETELAKVKGALATLFTKANALATVLSIDNVTYSGGGTDGAGTVAAMGVAVTAATTGAQATQSNTARVALNDAFYSLGLLVNRLAEATATAKLVLPEGHTFASTIAAIAGTVGTAASPAVTKAAMDAALVVWRNNTATIAARLNAMTADAPNPLVVAI